jgi:hypothetical protein
LPNGKATRLGSEHPAKSPRKPGVAGAGDVKSDVTAGQTGPADASGEPPGDPDLAAVVAAWPGLGAGVRAAVLELVRGAAAGG